MARYLAYLDSFEDNYLELQTLDGDHVITLDGDNLFKMFPGIEESDDVTVEAGDGGEGMQATIFSEDGNIEKQIYITSIIKI